LESVAGDGWLAKCAWFRRKLPGEILETTHTSTDRWPDDHELDDFGQTGTAPARYLCNARRAPGTVWRRPVPTSSPNPDRAARSLGFRSASQFRHHEEERPMADATASKSGRSSQALASAPRSHVGRRTVLGLVGLGTVGVVVGARVQSAVGGALTKASSALGGLGALIPGADEFRIYTVTNTIPVIKPAEYRLTVTGM